MRGLSWFVGVPAVARGFTSSVRVRRPSRTPKATAHPQKRRSARVGFGFVGCVRRVCVYFYFFSFDSPESAKVDELDAKCE